MERQCRASLVEHCGCWLSTAHRDDILSLDLSGRQWSAHCACEPGGATAAAASSAPAVPMVGSANAPPPTTPYPRCLSAAAALRRIPPPLDEYCLSSAGVSVPGRAAGATRFYVFGGMHQIKCDFKPTDRACYYDSGANAWTAIAPLPAALFLAAACAHETHIYVVVSAPSRVAAARLAVS